MLAYVHFCCDTFRSTLLALAERGVRLWQISGKWRDGILKKELYKDKVNLYMDDCRIKATQMMYVTLKKESMDLLSKSRDTRVWNFIHFCFIWQKKEYPFPVQELWITLNKMNSNSILKYTGLTSIVVYFHCNLTQILTCFFFFFNSLCHHK